MFSILGIIGTLVSWIGGLVSLFSKRAQQQQGAIAQAQEEISQVAKVETAIADAEAQAPRNMDEVIQREKEGTF